MAPRIKNLDECPSPYLNGKMDKFFSLNLMPLIQTVRGCPFSCTYCVEGADFYTFVSRKNNIKMISSELEYIAKRSDNNKQLFIADSNFGMYKSDIETAKIIGEIIEQWNYPRYIQVATGKNQKERILEVAKLLKGRLRLSGSVQSTNPVVLENINRKDISIDQLLSFSKEARKVGTNSYSEIILGLPGDSEKAHIQTMKDVIEAGFNFALPWTLILLKGSKLYGKENNEYYGLVRKYRVLPRCFGIYRFGNKEIISGEIEEVCISNNTLTFDDYIKCRLFTLTAALFYNDRIFEEIIESLKSLGLSPFRWLELIHADINNFPKNLKEIYEGFKKATLEELWDSEVELRKFISKKNVIKKYISNELGYNVLYQTRSEAFLKCMKDINDVAFKYAKEMITENKKDNYDYAFFNEMKQFSLIRKVDLFNFEQSTELFFNYDFKRILLESLWGDNQSNNYKGKFTYRFYHTDEQKQAVKEQMNVFGPDMAGLTKVLSRINISKIYRNVEAL
jgi:hypothetical protein